MSEDSGEKTEDATPHKLQEARKKGQIAKSKDATSAILLLLAFFVLKASAEGMWTQMSKIARTSFLQIGEEWTPGVIGVLLEQAMWGFLIAMAPLFGAIVLGAIVLEALQAGFLLSMEALEPKFEKLNPIEGFKKFFALKQYVELIKSIIKMSIVILVMYLAIKEDFYIILLAQEMSLWQLLSATGDIVMKVVIRVGLVFLAIAIFDYFYQRYEYLKSMKMSKKEIKDEYKRLEGDPLIKQRQREAARQMSQSRQMGSVPGADVVVTNPTHYAIALIYKPNEMDAPIVVARGKNLFAADIRRVAESNFIPIIENPSLAQGLYRSGEVGAKVPSQYYRAVAEILAFVYNLKKSRSRRF